MDSTVVFFPHSVVPSDDLQRFVARILDKSTTPTFYASTPEDKKIINDKSKNVYMNPNESKHQKCIVLAVCVLNFVRTYPSTYRAYGLAIG
jgi:hypothetical protein